MLNSIRTITTFKIGDAMLKADGGKFFRGISNIFELSKNKIKILETKPLTMVSILLLYGLPHFPLFISNLIFSVSINSLS